MEVAMARGELLRKLFESYKSRKDTEFKKTALEIIAEEKFKNNNQLAEDLQRLINKPSAGPKKEMKRLTNINNLPKDKERLSPLVEVRKLERNLQDIILNKENARSIRKIINEYSKSEVLKMHGILPSYKILFCGPPGCGKTLCSEVVASELGLPMLYTRFDSVVSSYLGETASNLRKIFDYASSGRWVVMFDEFDAIGKARDDQNEHGELKRVVNSFLQILDSFTANSLVIAATNHEQLLDPALWRRFDEIVFFPNPTIAQIRKMVELKFKNFPFSFPLKTSIGKMKNMSYSDVERLCIDSMKSAILESKDKVDSKTFEESYQRQRIRMKIAKEANVKRREK